MKVSSSKAHPPARNFGLFEKAKAIDATSHHLILLPIYVGQLHQRTSACLEHMLPGVRPVQRNRYFDPAVFRCEVIRFVGRAGHSFYDEELPALSLGDNVVRC